MNCEQIQELLSDLMDGELAEGARAGVESHLAACGDCTRVYGKLKRTVRFVRAQSGVDLRPGTPGGGYARFTRALVDPSVDATGEQVITEQGLLRERGTS